MRRGFVAAVVACLVVGAAAYLFGMSEGAYRAEAQYKAAWTEVNAQSSATSFLVATRAIELLREGDNARSEATLAILANLQVQSLRDCSRSISCSASVGPLLPSEERLRKFEQPDGPIRNK